MLPASPESRRFAIDRTFAGFALVAACALSIPLFAHYWQHSRDIWWLANHDRHTHYLNGLNLAQDVRSFEHRRLLHDLDALRVWGPLHSFLIAGIQLVAGPDHRLAVLPSFVGWILTVWLGFLITRRMLPSHGNLAGLVAAALLASLPAYRAYATDVMLESLGVALSLLVLYGYLMVIQDRTQRAGRVLAVSLIVLFFHKYNYWLLVVFGLCASECLRQPRAWWDTARAWTRREVVLPILKREVKNPLSWIAFLLFVVATFVWKRHGTTLSFGNVHITMREPHNLFMFAFWAFAARMWLWWRAEGRAQAQRLAQPVYPVLVWPAFAISMWFLLPKRLGYFLWYLSPANSSKELTSSTALDGVRYYLGALAEDYCLWPWQLSIVLSLVVLACLLARGLKPGSAAVFLFFAIGLILTVQHPMTKHRHAHTWVAALYILAVVGGYALLRKQPSWLAGGFSVTLLAVCVPSHLIPGRSQEGGVKSDWACPLVITDTYLPHLADAKHTTILGNITARFLFDWTFLEAHQHTRFATSIRHFKETLEHNEAGLTQWVEKTTSEAIVLVEARNDSPLAAKDVESPDLTTLKSVLAKQRAFRESNRWELTEGVSITLWRKGSIPFREFANESAKR